uniref:Uncharacterized protein n=1 Tax=viral metagenome TaxID=1070528 RepID=A0A6M3K943_9ZZZZ
MTDFYIKANESGASAISTVTDNTCTISARCMCCGKKMPSGLPNIWHDFCDDCRVCPKCGSEFILSHHKVGAPTTYIRCLGCLHGREIKYGDD